MKCLILGIIFLFAAFLIGLYAAVSVDFHTMEPDQAKLLFHITFLCVFGFCLCYYISIKNL